MLGREQGNSDAMALVFVYGSLKRGFLHHDELKGAVFLGTTKVFQHRLVIFEGAYPAMYQVDESSSFVEGEIFSVTEELVVALDAFEEVPHLYQRVRVEAGDGRRVWAYTIDRERASKYEPWDGPWLWSGKTSAEAETK